MELGDVGFRGWSWKAMQLLPPLWGHVRMGPWAPCIASDNPAMALGCDEAGPHRDHVEPFWSPDMRVKRFSHPSIKTPLPFKSSHLEQSQPTPLCPLWLLDPQPP